jgi:hypothetical protein
MINLIYQWHLNDSFLEIKKIKTKKKIRFYLENEYLLFIE